MPETPIALLGSDSVLYRLGDLSGAGTSLVLRTSLVVRTYLVLGTSLVLGTFLVLRTSLP